MTFQYRCPFCPDPRFVIGETDESACQHLAEHITTVHFPERPALRDEFAAKAMCGWLASFVDLPHPADDAHDNSQTAAKNRIRRLAERSYRIADAMLAARRRPPMV